MGEKSWNIWLSVWVTGSVVRTTKRTLVLKLQKVLQYVCISHNTEKENTKTQNNIWQRCTCGVFMTTEWSCHSVLLRTC